MSETLEAMVSEIAEQRPKAKMIRRNNPSAKQLKLRVLVEGVKAAEVECLWCLACKRGVTDSTAIPRKTAAMCIEHRALSVEWDRWFATAPETAPSIMQSITERGLQVARARMLAVIMKEVA